MRIETGSAKIRTGGPKDDKADLEDEAITSRVWAGVIPLQSHYEMPLPADTNKAKLPNFVEALTKQTL